MIESLKEGYAKKPQRRGRHQKLSKEDLMLATQEYMREDRTYAHIAASYDIAESNIYRRNRWIKDMLIKVGTFSLPDRKSLLKTEAEYEVILVDATDSGYQGLTKLHANYVLPKKSTKNQPLSKQDRKQNRNISIKRIAVEHVIALVKRYRILSERRKRFSLLFSLIAGICNFEQLS